MERNLNCTSAVIVRDKKILLGERMKKLGTGHEGSFWYTPGGRCDDGETPEQGLLREIKEEIGIQDAKIVTKLGEFKGVFEDEHGRDVPHTYLVTTAEEPKLMEPDKFVQWKWFTLPQLPTINLINRDRDVPIFQQAVSETNEGY